LSRVLYYVLNKG